jgi:hypothetical protein
MSKTGLPRVIRASGRKRRQSLSHAHYSEVIDALEGFAAFAEYAITNILSAPWTPRS